MSLSVHLSPQLVSWSHLKLNFHGKFPAFSGLLKLKSFFQTSDCQDSYSVVAVSSPLQLFTMKTPVWSPDLLRFWVVLADRCCSSHIEFVDSVSSWCVKLMAPPTWTGNQAAPVPGGGVKYSSDGSVITGRSCCRLSGQWRVPFSAALHSPRTFCGLHHLSSLVGCHLGFYRVSQHPLWTRSQDCQEDASVQLTA